MNTSMFLFAALPDDMWPLVCLIGVVVVFIGLATIIGLVELLTLVCNKILAKGEAKRPAVASAPAPSTTASTTIENRGEILAAVCAAVAEEEGTDISAIRVISFKKVQ